MEKDYLILKRASAPRPSGEWDDDDYDYDVLADGATGRSGFRLTTPSAEIIGARAERNRCSCVHLIGRETARGRLLVGEPVAMRRPGHIPFDRMKFPLTLAGGLRTAFADFVSTPLPRHLADLLRQLHEDRDNPLQGRGARSWGKHSRNIAPFG